MDPIEIQTGRVAELERLRAAGEPGVEAELEHQREQLRAMVREARMASQEDPMIGTEPDGQP